MTVRMDLSSLASSRTLVRRPARDLLHGCVALDPQPDGWVRPLRLTPAQMRAVGSVQAWHPGLFRTMAQTTAGVTLEFVTDSSEVALEVWLDGEPAGTRSMLKYVPDQVSAVSGEEGSLPPHDGFGLEVDGKRLDPLMPRVGRGAFSFWVDDPAKSPAAGIGQLPGLGDTHRVRVWLPCLRGCALRAVVGNGTLIEPVDQRPQLLVLGDSIAQGFVVGDPSLAWPALLARRSGLDLVNQSLGGQVFQPGTFQGLKEATKVARVVVALGANYRYEPCQEGLVRRDVDRYLRELDGLFPETPTYLVGPLWHAEEAYPSHARSCWRQVPRAIAEAQEPYGQMAWVDGTVLMDHDAALLADGYEHPGAKGSRQVAQRLGILVAHRERSQEDLRVVAQEALRKAPRRAIPLREMARRGLGTIEYAGRGCVLARTADGLQFIWASDHELGWSVIRTLVDAPVVACLEPALVDDVRAARSLDRVRPFRICYLDTPVFGAGAPAGSPGKTSLLAPRASDGAAGGPAFDVRPLDQSFFAQVRAGYDNPAFASDEDLRALLERGRVLGGFEGDDLVGFVGEHPCGSMGMLWVSPDHRGQGWGRALLGAKVEAQAALGWTPWSEVFEDNRASLRLHRSLGLKVTPASDQCYLS